MAYVIDQPNCSCCHRCKVECPTGAIHFKNSKYWIDPDKCTDCGLCATVCHNGVISDPVVLAKVAVHKKIMKNCDIVVIGGGAAGMVAAAKAADLGKKVIVLEKNHEVGGSAWYAHMLRTLYSKWHKAAGIKDERDRIYDQFMKKTGGRVNGKLVSRIFDANADFIDWLIDRGDLEKGFELGDGPFGAKGLVGKYKWDYNEKRVDPSIGPGGTGWYMANLMKDILESKGGEIIYNTEAAGILSNKDGAITGVIAKDAGGEIEIQCKSVVVAAGAFTRNREIMKKMQPSFYDDAGNEPVHIFTCSTCTGDGITMCEAIGADIDYENRRVVMFSPVHHPFSYCVLTMSRTASGVLVNRNGDLIDAPFDMKEIGVLADQPGRIAWLIVDSRAVKEAVKNGSVSHCADMCDPARVLTRWKEELEEEIELGLVYKGDTLEELGKNLEFDPQKFAALIKSHNENLGKKEPVMPPPGDDDNTFVMPPMPPPQPLETPPYYAIFQKIFHENSIGGMTINENTSVLRKGVPIPGLFAAGDNTRGIMLPGDIGVKYIEGIISALTFAMNSGYIAGIEAVKHADIIK